MKKYSKAVSEMYSQFKKVEAHPLEKVEAHPLEKYIGRLTICHGKKVEVVGYHTDMSSTAMLIVGVSKYAGWSYLKPHDVVFKKCESYLYVGISSLID